MFLATSTNWTFAIALRMIRSVKHSMHLGQIVIPLTSSADSLYKHVGSVMYVGLSCGAEMYDHAGFASLNLCQEFPTTLYWEQVMV